MLEARHLRIELRTPQGMAPAVRELSFTLQPGDTLGLIGESGCGKSMSALALMGLTPENARISGSLRLHGQELLGLPERDWQRLRGARLAMIFQEPMTALNPLHTIGRQIMEPLRLHRRMAAAQARERALGLLERVGIAQPAQRFDSYPHQFSGGQRQRIMIAMALACEPDVLIADEPTTALDATVQQQILALIRQLAAERGMALVLISHDLGLVAQNVQHMLVMYGGCVVESGPVASIFAAPAHPYTRGLLAARPSLAQRSARLPTIAGHVPALADLPPGCPFAGRCSRTLPICASQPAPHITREAGHSFNCHNPPPATP